MSAAMTCANASSELLSSGMKTASSTIVASVARSTRCAIPPRRAVSLPRPRATHGIDRNASMGTAKTS